MFTQTPRSSFITRSKSSSLRTLGAVAAMGTVGALLAACGSSSPTAATTTSTTPAGVAALSALEVPPTSPVSLQETGSTLLYPLFNLWAPGYNKLYSNVTINTAGTGSGAGISQAAAGTVNIGASDAYLSPAQVQQNPGLINVPLAISAQQINYNLPGVTGNLKLNGQILSAMYQGTITSWNDPKIAAINPGVTLPSLKVTPLHRSDGSGDTFLFSTYLSKQDASGWGQKIGFGTTVAFPAISSALGENGNGGMVSGCAATPGCVAYIGISFLSQTNAKGLGEAQLENASGNYLLPTQTTILAEAASFNGQVPATGTISMINGPASGGYPIINFEYGIVNTTQSSATVAQGIKAFLAWTMDPNAGGAPSYVNQVQFQPLPTSVLAIAANLLSKIQ